MRIASLGGGPSGLYFSILMKKAFPDSEITVFERNRADDTFGFGVVFSDETLGHFETADPESYAEIRKSFAYWGDIETYFRDTCVRSTGHGFCGLARKKLLQIFHERCRRLGVKLEFEREIKDEDELSAFDLILAADGINSIVRKKHEAHFKPTFDWRKAKFCWLGTTRPLSAFTFVFKETEWGVFQVHAYPFEKQLSTWIVECDENTWRKAGLDTASEPDTVAFCEKLFAENLDGHALISNRSIWRSFPTIRCERWHHGKTVLVGDAAHTAHFSIGSGTKLALEDSIALAQAFVAHGTKDVPRVLAAYEEARHIEVSKVQHAAQTSLEWFEHSSRYMQQHPLQFTFNLMTRSKRITWDNLAKRDPELVRRVGEWYAAENGIPHVAEGAGTSAHKAAASPHTPLASAHGSTTKPTDPTPSPHASVASTAGATSLLPGSVAKASGASAPLLGSVSKPAAPVVPPHTSDSQSNASTAESLGYVAPPLFAPLTLRGMTLENRVVVSPMCQYSAVDGTVTDWHLVHLGSRAVGGAALVIAEMTDVTREGRISLGCAGMYKEEHVAAWKRIVDFVHAHSRAKIGIQLAHAGRKGSCNLPWEGDNPLRDARAWTTLAPSPLPFYPGDPPPKEMDRADMDRTRAAFVQAARMAERAGFDMLELHMAHGYLLSSFLSPKSNQRRDSYGGLLENRMRYPLEVFAAVRAVWPEQKPIFVRISASDWLDDEGGWTVADSVVFARELKQLGCDLVDVSSGGNTPESKVVYGRMYQVPFAEQIRAEAGIPVMSVGGIQSADHVNTILAAGRADLCAMARPHLTDPYLTQHAAGRYGNAELPWPNQYLAVRPRSVPRPD